MPERRYKAGTRRTDLGKSDAEMSPNRFAWLKCVFGQLVIMVHPTEPVEDDFDVKILYPQPSGRNIYFDLTSMTEEELDAFDKLMSTAIKWARPIVKERDKRAADAFAAGDDRFPRVYRALPQLIFRKGHERAHWKELRERREGDAGVVGVPGDPNSGLPPAGGQVPE
jgi:hypothetical protein